LYDDVTRVLKAAFEVVVTEFVINMLVNVYFILCLKLK